MTSLPVAFHALASHPIDIWGGADLRGLWMFVAVVAAVPGLAAGIPAVVWPLRGRLGGTGALVARSVLGWVGSTSVATSLFFVFVGLKQTFERGHPPLAELCGWLGSSMFVVGPVLVAASLLWDVALGIRLGRATGTSGPLVYAVLAAMGAIVHLVWAVFLTYTFTTSTR